VQMVWEKINQTIMRPGEGEPVCHTGREFKSKRQLLSGYLPIDVGPRIRQAFNTSINTRLKFNLAHNQAVNPRDANT